VTPLRIFLADDHPVVLAGMRSLVEAEPDLRVVGEAGDTEATLAGAAAVRPDVLVLDLSMPGGGGVQVASRLGPASRCVVLTQHEEGAYVRRLLELGVAGYVLKRSAATELVRAIRVAAAGGIHVDPAIAAEAFGRPAPVGGPTGAAAGAPRAAEGPALSQREQAVLRLVAAGHANKEIAHQLGISTKTVETHRARGMEKLGLASRVGLVRYALAQGWLANSGD
jgi:DNA-binding NarL/FixJ family response regulator